MARIGVLLALLLLGLSCSQAFAQSFAEFEADCRLPDNGLDCPSPLLSEFAGSHGTTPDRVACDAQAFWTARDARGADLADKMWPEAIEILVGEPGVCSLLAPLTATCPPGSSQDPIAVRSWTVAADPEDPDYQIVNVTLTSALDHEIVSVSLVVRFFNAAAVDVMRNTVSFNDHIVPGADLTVQTKVNAAGDVFADPAAMTVLACTSSVVDTNDVTHTY